MGSFGHDEAERWDGFYAGDGDAVPHWSGRPNPTLVREVAGLAPGHALDVGCGEGADAIWLAQHGWRVTAIDPSRIALERARAAARQAGVEVTWVRAGLLDLPDGHGPYDLVSTHYPVLPRGEGDVGIAALLAAVGPGGTVLVVHHVLDAAHAAEHGFDLDDHVTPDTVAPHLDEGWEAVVAETRDRDERASGDDHPRDVVLRAHRR
jgi:SAM-dependent methyltransferase